MEDKEKQIAEMAQIINGSTELDTVAYYRCMNIAKTIYNAGYQKLPEDSVVLSREEWKQIKNSLYYSKEELDKKLVKERNEMAEKIFKMLISKLESNQFLSGKRIIMEVDVENLAKQFDVEIEEL